MLGTVWGSVDETNASVGRQRSEDGTDCFVVAQISFGHDQPCRSWRSLTQSKRLPADRLGLRLAPLSGE